MQSFGPLTLTANTLTQVSCSPASVNIYIGNDSPYDVLVSFSVSQPPLVTSAAGTSDWTGVVQAFHHCTLPTPQNIGSPQGSTFAGVIWLLPLDTRNTDLAQNGTVSSTSNAWVIACLKGETPPDAYAAPRQTDITSQTRVVCVPIVPFTLVYQTPAMTPVNQATPAGGTTLIKPSSGWPLVFVYLYGLYAQQSNATTTWSQWEIGFSENDNLGNPLTNHAMIRAVVTGNTGATPPLIPPVTYTPAQPLMLSFTPAANAFTVQFYLRLQASQGSAATVLNISAQIGGDPWNGIAPPQIGGGQNRTILSVGPGTIF